MSDVFWNDVLVQPALKAREVSISQQKIKYSGLWSPHRHLHGQCQDRCCHCLATQLTSGGPGIPRLHQLLSPIHVGFSDIVIPSFGHSQGHPLLLGPKFGTLKHTFTMEPILVHSTLISRGSQSWFASSRNPCLCCRGVLLNSHMYSGTSHEGSALLHC